MTKLYQTLPVERRLEAAVLASDPTALARTVAGFTGQFYDRADFDALARRVSDIYAARHPADADAFRARLDRRLYDRFYPPVAWDAGAAPSRPAA